MDPAPKPRKPEADEESDSGIFSAALEHIKEFFELFPEDGNIELSLLKGHLLIERHLNKLIERGTEHPEFIPKELRFAQKLKLARSHSQNANKTHLWTAISLLNEARNELSHSLETKELEKLIQKFINFVEKFYHYTPDLSGFTKRYGRFHWALALVNSHLTTELIVGPHLARVPIGIAEAWGLSPIDTPAAKIRAKLIRQQGTLLSGP